MLARTAALALGLALFASPALAADPCTAIPDSGRPWPSYLVKNKPFRGAVSHIIDGDGLCVATGNGSNTWVEVRLQNFFAPELNEGGRHAQEVLRRIAFGKSIICVPHPGRNGRIDSYDRVIARCQIGNRDLGDLMRGAGVREGGKGR